MKVGGLMRRLAVTGGVAVMFLGLSATAASAAPGAKPHLSHGTNGVAGSSGSAKKINEGNGGVGALLTSDNDGYGLINVPEPVGTTLSELTALNTGYEVTEGTCSGGAPRFAVVVLPPGAKKADAQVLWVYFGTQPYGGCSAQQGLSTEDATQDDWWLAPGNNFESYAQALSTMGTDRLVAVQVAVDAGWDQSPDVQQVLIQNLTVGINGVNSTFYPLPG